MNELLTAGLNQFFEDEPLEARQKRESLLSMLNLLTEHHLACGEYGEVVRRIFGGRVHASCLEEVPFVPVRLFKRLRLSSVEASEEFKTLVSSGTTGQLPSVIVLDRQTAGLQRKALAAVMQGVIGRKRLPMMIVDTPAVLKDRQRFSARAAGILGMMNFGRDHHWALDDEMQLDRDALDGFVSKYAGQPVLLFGFTFMVWRYLVQRFPQEALQPPLFEGGVLVHSGGWKKLTDEAVSREEFNRQAMARLGVSAVHNFYGMVEQVGSVFLDCEEGLFHASRFSEIIIRDPVTLEHCENGTSGVVECLSVLPLSYPGHAILTEDMGVVRFADGACPCGRPGTAFELLGRVPMAELRGCSDTHAAARL